MDLPSSRELELEILLRERDAQLSELTDEVKALRQYLAKQPETSMVDPITLPHHTMAILLPHLKNAVDTSTNSTSTVTAALTQRARLLQEENDELYDLLKVNETGKLKDEVRGLRRVVSKLEVALQDSHQIIKSLQTELEKAYDTLMSSSRQISSVPQGQSHSRSPRNSYHPSTHSENYSNNGNGTSKQGLPPTAPRAHKKPRLSEPQVLSPQRPMVPLPHKPQNHAYANLPSRPDAREQPRHSTDSRPKANHRMDVDESHTRAISPPVRERERPRERERGKDRDRGAKEREKERERGKDWERDSKQSTARRNGNYSGPRGSSGQGRKGSDRNHNLTSINHPTDSSTRTLQERLGL